MLRPPYSATPIVCCAVLALAGCAPPEESTGSNESAGDSQVEAPTTTRSPVAAAATVEAIDDAAISGRVDFEQVGEFVRIEGRFDGLDEGQYGFHIHEGFECDDRGSHYDPTGTPHGSPDEPGSLRHVGDLGNLVARGGSAEYFRIDPVARLEGEQSIIGRVVVVHAGRDQLLPQPTGGAGNQIGCGVIEPADGGGAATP